MCGLVVTLLAPKKRGKWELEQVWNIFTHNLIQNEQRGKEATGVGVIQNDGTRRVWKLPLPASKFTGTEDYLQHTREAFTPDTICLLGHTRRPTKGDVGYSNNNHPILTEHIIGVHNGNIKNDDDIFRNLSVERRGEVDSEAIFSLIETIPEEMKDESYQRAIASRVELLSGLMTTVSMDIRRPGELLVLKRDMPFSMHYEKAFDALFFSSRYVFLRRAFGRSVVTEALESKRGYLFYVGEFTGLQQRYSAVFPI
jgi:glucosamine 6-phosphate synthetase-like amidotransferase/phosphosugar isomerase protein